MTTTVLVPFVDDLHPDTRTALDAHASGGYVTAELFRGDPMGYWALLRDEWTRPGDLVIVEHDVVIHASVLGGFVDCPGEVCGHPYEGDEMPSFGCTRLRESIKAAVPDLFDEIGPTTWQRLDLSLGAALGRHGYSLCAHVPAVGHRSGKTREEEFEQFAASLPQAEPLPDAGPQLVARLRKLRLAPVETWQAVAVNLLDRLTDGSLSPTDAAIAVFDSAARPTWDQARGFVDAVIDTHCPQLRTVPDFHLVARSPSGLEVTARKFEAIARKIEPGLLR